MTGGLGRRARAIWAGRTGAMLAVLGRSGWLLGTALTIWRAGLNPIPASFVGFSGSGCGAGSVADRPGSITVSTCAVGLASQACSVTPRLRANNAAPTIHAIWPRLRGASTAADAGSTQGVLPCTSCCSRCAFFRALLMMLISGARCYAAGSRALPPKCSRAISVCRPALPSTGSRLSR